MENKIVYKEYKIDGMSCGNCALLIEQALKALNGVSSVKVSYSDSSAKVEFDESLVTEKEVIDAIKHEGYTIKTEESSDGSAEKSKGKNNIIAVLGIVFLAIAIYYFGNSTGGLNFMPEITQSMGYGLLFVVGLLTSVHCIAMCGGINLSQSISKDSNDTDDAKTKVMPTVLYNSGRVISYTVIGGLVGALGSVVSFSGRAKGIVAIIAGVFMLIMGLNMLNIFPWIRKLVPRMPSKLSTKVHGAKRGKGPLIVGLLNGFMPCGPLQAMQIYALGTGSFITGALSMFMFSLGTVPLMVGFGALSSFLSSKFTKKLMWVSGALVMILGIVMFGRGLNQSGISVSLPYQEIDNSAVVEENIQEISTEMHPNVYESFSVQAGIPVRWTINVEEGDLNGCNNPLTIPKYGIEKRLEVGENIIEFTPEKEGNILYTCWMGMIDGNIKVVSNIADTSEANTVEAIEQQGDLDKNRVDSGEEIGQGCGVSAGPITADNVGIATIENGVQTITVNVNELGFSPSVIVLQKDIPTKWNIIGEKLDYCNNSLIFPAYNAKLDLQEGDNIIDFEPAGDFDYSCWMNMINGYVRVVDDINEVDIEEIINDPTLVPASSATSGCCG